ncbi:MAG: hypothetical protein IKE31_01850 [Eubacterium sp.]|nr:hypothetical protein [Eubacterium sp.]
MSRYQKKKRHGFLKFIMAVLILAALGVLGAWYYVRYYPGGSVENLKYHARQAHQMIQHAASGVKETVRETISDPGSGRSLRSQLKGTDDINLRNGGDGYYYFTYNGEDFRALYAASTWTIYDSYKITNKKDITIICQALSDIYPVPSRDWQSYRTAEDMAYEWDQHNKIYLIAPKDGRTRERTRNVDLDPEDQGKTYEDLYHENLG